VQVDPGGNPTLRQLALVAKEHSVYLRASPLLFLAPTYDPFLLCAVAGSMQELEGGKAYVTSLLFAPDGSIPLRYRKRKPTIAGAVPSLFRRIFILHMYSP